MATAPRVPMFEDQLLTWQNQRLCWLLIGSGAAIAILIATLCWMASRPQNIPYVLEVNQKGEPVGAVQPLQGNQRIGENVIRWSLGEYIRQAMQVSRSFDENQMNLGRAYSLSTGQASDALTAYYRGNHDANNPLSAYSRYWQDVKILRVLKLPADRTYQVDYEIDKHDFDHPFDGVKTDWRATMRVIQGAPTSNNALGLWVDALDFAQEMK
jgi:type IV secretory pathway TrbF-like protein